MKQFFPILNWLGNYKRSDFPKDILGGLTIGVLLVPQGMAYAMIAGLPPVYGLYAALFPVVLYAILGTSRQIAVGPVAMDSLLVGAGLGMLSITSVEEYVLMAVFLCFLVGSIQLVLGVLRMGFLVNFLSKPVISGFTTAAGIIIICSQLKHILGIKIPGGSTFYENIINLVKNSGSYYGIDIFLGLSCILIVILLKKWNPKIPAHLIVVVIGILSVKYFNFEVLGVHIVGEVPKGLPSFSIPGFNWEGLPQILPIAVTLALVGYLEAISIGKVIEEKTGNETVNPNQELIALGSANLVGSFFQAYPTTASFSRSAISLESGAKTPIASLIAMLMVVLTLLYLTPLFYFLPNAVLAAIIMVSVFGLLDFANARSLFLEHKDEFFVWVLTFAVTLFIGIPQGILSGVMVALLLMVYRSSRPHIAELAQIKGTKYFKNVDRFKNEIIHREGLLILRFDAQLYYANVTYFKSQLWQKLEAHPNTNTIILNAEAINYIDATGAKTLIKIITQLREMHINFYIAGAIGPARDVIFKSGIFKELGDRNLFIRVNEAVEYYERPAARSEIGEIVALQNLGEPTSEE